MDELRKLAAETLQIPVDSLPTDRRAETIPEWDSVGHLNLVLAIEQRFGVTFATDEISQMTDLATIQRMLDSKQRG